MYFTEKQLKKITGFTYPKYQTRWLEEHKLGYTWNSKGKLNVLVEDYIKKYGLKDTKPKLKNQEPDFDVIRDINGKKAKKTQTLTAEGDL
jgi:hypothetical protein